MSHSRVPVFIISAFQSGRDGSDCQCSGEGDGTAPVMNAAPVMIHVPARASISLSLKAFGLLLPLL